MPTALGASCRHVCTVAVVAVTVAAAALVGAAAVAGLVVAAPAAAAVAFLLAVLLGGAEELEGASGHRVIFVSGGVDFLFRAGIDSVPGEVVVATLLQLFLEQEPEVLAVGLGIVVFRDDPEVELLCIPMQRSERLVRCRRVVFRRRLSALGDGVEGGDGGTRGRGEREGSRWNWSQRRRRLPWLQEVWVLSVVWLREEDEFVVKGVDSG